MSQADIVDRLRNPPFKLSFGEHHIPPAPVLHEEQVLADMLEAANEIERLRRTAGESTNASR